MARESREQSLSLAQALQLAAGGYALDLEPEEGGAVARFEWEGEALFRARCGEGPLNSACFPLAPFSNRIAFGRFTANGRLVQLAPNFPGSDHPHTLHGYGWLNAWRVEASNGASATLSYRHEAGAWPWCFEARQSFILSAAGLRHQISVRNLSDAEMPVGVGLHPYFPSTPQTIYRGLHRGEWETSADGLPLGLRLEDRAIDWWRARPVATRAVDTVYVGREGALVITWPERNLRLAIEPSAELSFTTVYAPPGADFFCVEPVSHQTNAINEDALQTGQRWLAPCGLFSAHVHYGARRLVREGESL